MRPTTPAQAITVREWFRGMRSADLTLSVDIDRALAAPVCEYIRGLRVTVVFDGAAYERMQRRHDQLENIMRGGLGLD